MAIIFLQSDKKRSIISIPLNASGSRLIKESEKRGFSSNLKHKGNSIDPDKTLEKQGIENRSVVNVELSLKRKRSQELHLTVKVESISRTVEITANGSDKAKTVIEKTESKLNTDLSGKEVYLRFNRLNLEDSLEEQQVSDGDTLIIKDESSQGGQSSNSDVTMSQNDIDENQQTNIEESNKKRIKKERLPDNEEKKIETELSETKQNEAKEQNESKEPKEQNESTTGIMKSILNRVPFLNKEDSKQDDPVFPSSSDDDDDDPDFPSSDDGDDKSPSDAESDNDPPDFIPNIDDPNLPPGGDDSSIKMAAEIESLKQQVKKLQEEKQKIDKKREQAEIQLENSNERIKTYDTSNKILSNQLERVKQDQTDIKSLREENAELRKQYSEVAAKDQKITNLENQIAEKDKSVSEKDKSINDKLASIRNLEAQLKTVRNDLQTSYKESGNINILRLQDKLEAKDIELENQKRDLRGWQDRAEREEYKYAELQREYNKSQTIITRQQQRLDNFGRSLQFGDDKEKFEQMTKKMKEEHEQSSRNLQNQLDQMEIELQETKRELENSNITIDAKKQANLNLRKSLAKKKEKIKKLEQKLEESKKNADNVQEETKEDSNKREFDQIVKEAEQEFKEAEQEAKEAEQEVQEPEQDDEEKQEVQDNKGKKRSVARAVSDFIGLTDREETDEEIINKFIPVKTRNFNEFASSTENESESNTKRAQTSNQLTGDTRPLEDADQEESKSKRAQTSNQLTGDTRPLEDVDRVESKSKRAQTSNQITGTKRNAPKDPSQRIKKDRSKRVATDEEKLEVLRDDLDDSFKQFEQADSEEEKQGSAENILETLKMMKKNHYDDLNDKEKTLITAKNLRLSQYSHQKNRSPFTNIDLNSADREFKYYYYEKLTKNKQKIDFERSNRLVAMAEARNYANKFSIYEEGSKKQELLERSRFYNQRAKTSLQKIESLVNSSNVESDDRTDIRMSDVDDSTFNNSNEENSSNLPRPSGVIADDKDFASEV